MSATIRDVAEAAGVSTATVSRALHADARVTASTRLKVEQAAERLAYRPSAAAARLATGRHGTVAVVAPGGLPPGGADLLAGVCAVLAQHDVECALELGCGGAVTGALRDLVGRADAALLLAPVEGVVVDLTSVGLPVVLLGASAGDDGVDVDLVESAALAAGHLHAMGYAQVAVLGEGGGNGLSKAEEMGRALRGRAGLAALLPPTLVPGGGVEAAARTTAAMLAGSQRPDALVCTSDRLARGAHRALLRHNLAPGEDVGLVGLGTEQVLEELDVTMVVEPLRELGAEGAREALRLLGVLDVAARRTLRPQLAVGSSTLRLRRRSAAG